MNAKDAVTVAKAFYEDMFNERPTLEEIWFEDTEGAWCVTFGRRRQVNSGLPVINAL